MTYSPTPTPRTVIIAEAVATPKSQFKNANGMLQIIASMAAQCQKFEDAINTVRLGFSIDTAGTAGLDILGKWTDVPRTGLDNDNYRALMKATIRARRSNGFVEDIREVLRLAREGTYKIHPLYPMSIYVEAWGVWGVSVAPTIILGLLQLAREAGVETSLAYSIELDANTLQFASGDVIEYDADSGFANAAGTTGGSFVEYLR
jgi:hypothetical protein